MLERPDLQDEAIAACLQAAYGIHTAALAFLPLGADQNTAVFRVVAQDATGYFLKLRSGPFVEVSVSLPKFLYDHGIAEIVAPLPAMSGRLWSSLDGFSVLLYPYIEGQDAYTVPLTDEQWRRFGAAVRRIHAAPVPAALRARIPQESFPAQWRDALRRTLDRLDHTAARDALAVDLIAFMQQHRTVMHDLVERTARLAAQLQTQPPATTVCHTDLHAGNLLIHRDGALYIVDWDAPLQAPKERDLMFAGGGQFANRRTPAAEEALFYQGYGPIQVNAVALAYYRYARIIEDLVIYSDQLLLSSDGGEDRAQALTYFQSNFQSGGAIEIAYTGDSTRGEGG
jgi:spectinomycin phosphotransferase